MCYVPPKLISADVYTPKITLSRGCSVSRFSALFINHILKSTSEFQSNSPPPPFLLLLVCCFFFSSPTNLVLSLQTIWCLVYVPPSVLWSCELEAFGLYSGFYSVGMFSSYHNDSLFGVYRSDSFLLNYALTDVIQTLAKWLYGREIVAFFMSSVVTERESGSSKETYWNLW